MHNIDRWVGGRFLVGLKDIDSSVKDTNNNNENIEHLLQDIDFMNCLIDNVALSEDSREVSCHIAGYIAKKLEKRYGSCCNQFLIVSPITSESLQYPYIKILLRGELTIPSLNCELCVDCLCDSRFSIWSYI